MRFGGGDFLTGVRARGDGFGVFRLGGNAFGVDLPGGRRIGFGRPLLVLFGDGRGNSFCVGFRARGEFKGRRGVLILVMASDLPRELMISVLTWAASSGN